MPMRAATSAERDRSGRRHLPALRRRRASRTSATASSAGSRLPHVDGRLPRAAPHAGCGASAGTRATGSGSRSLTLARRGRRRGGRDRRHASIASAGGATFTAPRRCPSPSRPRCRRTTPARRSTPRPCRRRPSRTTAHDGAGRRRRTAPRLAARTRTAGRSCSSRIRRRTGRPAALATAEQGRRGQACARSGSSTRAGYASLQPGYFVVFTGIYARRPTPTRRSRRRGRRASAGPTRARSPADESMCSASRPGTDSLRHGGVYQTENICNSPGSV